jgi:hypothetical protein
MINDMMNNMMGGKITPVAFDVDHKYIEPHAGIEPYPSYVHIARI